MSTHSVIQTAGKNQDLPEPGKQSEMEHEWGVLALDDVLRRLDTDIESGLSADEAEKRMAKHGPNELAYRPQASILSLLAHQFLSSVVLLLIAAAAISFLTGEHLQSAGILAAVFINAIVGFFTELKAQMSLEALKKISGPTARIRRGGKDMHVAARELVPGDLVLLEAGVRIPAEIRIVESAALTVDESILTGESVPAYKSGLFVEGEEATSTLGFHGTYVLKGRGTGVVIATGRATRLGQLQCLLTQTASGQTPLEKRLEVLGGQLSILTLFICAALAVVGILYKEDVWAMLETSIALAVAAIPEGLPVVATLALAMGTQRMVKLGALMRELAAVETLGCTTVICTDKTGTLTENQMIATDIVLDRRVIKVSGVGYEPKGELTEGEEVIDPEQDDVLTEVLRAGALCNDARIERSKDDTWQVHGDPTEGALLAAAYKGGLEHKMLTKEFPRIGEIPFDLNRKRMTTIHDTGEQSIVAFVKGSPEQLIQACSSVNTASGIREMTADDRQWYGNKNEELAHNGLRVLALAMKTTRKSQWEEWSEKIEQDLTFLGLVGMRDLPRKGVHNALKKCHEAGIHVIMLTGDQPATARSIARDLNIIGNTAQEKDVLSGSDLEAMSADEMKSALQATKVLARVNPAMKLSIVKNLQERGEVVAMTGDGVNDAPALRQADIGVAMGLCGTDLAREASNMVITDDNFSTIVTAIEQGRIIYENIKRAICYLLTASIGSLLAIAIAIIIHDPLPLTPLQLLWLNLIMHVFPALGIVLQRAPRDLMRHPPRNPEEQLLERREFFEIITRGVLVSLSVIAAVQCMSLPALSGESLTAMSFTTIALSLLFQAWAWLGVGRHGSVRPNMLMWLMMIISYGLIFLALYVPPVSLVLETRPLGPA
ncbi:MAG TPA: cation-transporting P-type ATPase, partial [Candidatus Obscuribacterales bacterium]